MIEAIFRVLSVLLVDGIRYSPNQLVTNLPESYVASYKERGMISDKPADIAYCKDKLGTEVIIHPSKEPALDPEAEAKAAAAAEKEAAAKAETPAKTKATKSTK